MKCAARNIKQKQNIEKQLWNFKQVFVVVAVEGIKIIIKKVKKTKQQQQICKRNAAI